VPSPRLVATVDALDPVEFAGLAYRHLAAKWNPLSGAGARSAGGRWNPPESFATLYLAGEQETVIAEFERMAARAGRVAEDFLPRRLYRYEVRLAGLLDLRTPDARASVELHDDQLLSDDPAACQAIGEAAQYVGREGVIAPSATGSGTVLAVFFDRLGPDSVIQVIDFETWEAAPSR
jgi:RES domain-containing protein